MDSARYRKARAPGLIRYTGGIAPGFGNRGSPAPVVWGWSSPVSRVRGAISSGADPEIRGRNQPAIFRSDGSEGAREARTRERYMGLSGSPGAARDPGSGAQGPNLRGSRSGRCIDGHGPPRPHVDRPRSYGTAPHARCHGPRAHDCRPPGANEPTVRRATPGRSTEVAGRLDPYGEVLVEPLSVSSLPVPRFGVDEQLFTLRSRQRVLEFLLCFPARVPDR